MGNLHAYGYCTTQRRGTSYQFRKSASLDGTHGEATCIFVNSCMQYANACSLVANSLFCCTTFTNLALYMEQSKLKCAYFYIIIISYLTIQIEPSADIICCISEKTSSYGQSMCKISDRILEINIDYNISRCSEACLQDTNCSSYKYSLNDSVCSLKHEIIVDSFDYLAHNLENLTSDQVL